MLTNEMSSQTALRDAEEELRSPNPSPGLQRQIPPDETLQWAVEKDLRTAWFSAILHKLKMMVVLFVGGIIASMAVTGAAGGLFGLLTFLLVSIGAPVGYVAYKYHYMKNTNIEYAGTDEQFIRYKDTPSVTETDSLPLNRAKDAKFRQDRWDKFLDTGNIRIQGIGTARNMWIKDVPDAEVTHRVIQEQIAETEQVDDIGAVQQGRIR